MKQLFARLYLLPLIVVIAGQIVVLWQGRHVGTELDGNLLGTPERFYVAALDAASRGDTARALYELRRAQTELPRESELEEQLHSMRARRAVASDLDLPPGDSRVVSGPLFLPRRILGKGDFELLSLLFSTLFCWAISSHRGTPFLRSVVCLFALYFGILGFGTVSNGRGEFMLSLPWITQVRGAAVVLAEAKVHAGHGEDLQTIATFFPGEEVVTGAEAGEWVELLLAGERSGWIAREALLPLNG